MQAKPELTAELVRSLFAYKDGQLIALRRRGSCSAGDPVGTTKRSGHLIVMVSGRQVFVHRIVFLLHHGYLPQAIDHINGDPADNRIENLRACDGVENARNRCVVTGKVKFKGVSYHARAKRFQASIGDRGRVIYLGIFKTPEEAAKVYDEAAKRLFGSFAKTNFDLGLIHSAPYSSSPRFNSVDSLSSSAATAAFAHS